MILPTLRASRSPLPDSFSPSLAATPCSTNQRLPRLRPLDLDHGRDKGAAAQMGGAVDRPFGAPSLEDAPAMVHVGQ
jgi:hypothetical protein